jgi:hypothetical protein
MARRADPELIYQAQRAGNVGRLTSFAGLDASAAEAWLAAWEREAGGRSLDRHSQDYWPLGWEWIAAQRETRARPS